MSGTAKTAMSEAILAGASETQILDAIVDANDSVIKKEGKKEKKDK